MFLEKVKSDGLSHMSYIIGDSGTAAVIDPRRDCQVYLDLTYQNGAQIKYIFETHRNEDYVIGSLELAQMTGAEILHGQDLPFAYGRGVDEGTTPSSPKTAGMWPASRRSSKTSTRRKSQQVTPAFHLARSTQKGSIKRC